MPDLQRAIIVYSGPQQTTAIDYSDPAETDWTRTELANAANAGESASSTWVVRDEAGRIPDYRANNNKFLSSHNYTIATVGSNTLWRGRIEAQDVKRGVQVGTRPHEFTQTMSDANSHLRGIVVHNWERPSETDAARVQALVAAYLSGNPRVTTNLNGSNFVITGSNTTTLKPRTYTAQSPAEILAHMAEVFDKEMFVDVDNNLHYHGHDYNGFDSPFRISDDINDLNSTTCLTIEPRASEESTNQLTSVRLYWGADEEQRSVVVNDTPSRTTDYWQEAVFDSEAESTAEATEVAQGILDARRLDQVSYQVRIGKPGTIQAGNGTPMTGDDIQHVKAGQRIYFKSRAARSGIGANGSFTGDSFQLVRIREVRWTMPTPDAYWCDLTLERPLIPKKRRGRTAPRSSVPKPAPEVEPQPEDTITVIAHWQWNATHGTLDDTDTYDSNITRHSSAHSWTGPPAGSITADHGDCGNSGEIFDAVPVTAGTTVSVTIGKFRWKWGPHPLFVNFYSTTDGTGVAIETWTFESGSGKSTNVLYTNIGGTHVAPVGTQSARIQFSSGLGLSVVDDVTIGTIDPADEVVNDPHAVNYGDDCPHESPHFLPSDYVECRLGLLQDEINAISASEDFGSHAALTGLDANDHPQYQLVHSGGQETISVVAASGSTETLDLTNGNFQDVTLTANCTLTLTGATAGVACTMALLLRQDGTGSRTVTWPASVEWVGGVAPTLQTAANTWDWVALVTLNGGTTWFAQHASGSVAAETSVPPAILLESGHAVPFTFDEILQTSDGSDFLWASE